MEKPILNVIKIEFNETSEIKIEKLQKHMALILIKNISTMEFRSMFFLIYYESNFFRPKLFEIVFNHSDIWPNILHEVKRGLIELMMELRKPLDFNHDYSVAYQNNGSEIDVLKELENCNNTAFIDEETKINEWEMILRHKGITKLSVGKEILASGSIGYQISGWMPMFIYRRIGGVKSSGIIEWWNKIFSVHLAKVRANVKRLTLSDKILYEYYNTKVKNEDNSRAFFAIFYLVLEVGLLAVICCALEFASYFRKHITRKSRKLIGDNLLFTKFVIQRTWWSIILFWSSFYASSRKQQGI